MNCMGLDPAPAWLFGAAALGVGHEVNSESRSWNLPIEDPEREKAMYILCSTYMSALYHSACFFPSLSSKPVSLGAGGVSSAQIAGLGIYPVK